MVVGRLDQKNARAEFLSQSSPVHIYGKMKHCNQNLTLLSKNETIATEPYTQASFELLSHITSNTLMGFI